MAEPFIRHISGIAEIVDDVPAAVEYYRNVLKLEVEHEAGSPYAVVKVSGVPHFGLWARSAAAERVYGSPEAAPRIPLGFSVEFEADEVSSATDSVRASGVNVPQGRSEEPWGQITSRFFSPSGALVGLTETPWARKLGE